MTLANEPPSNTSPGDGSSFRLSVSQQERDAGRLEEGQREQACQIFQQQGALWLENCFPRKLIQKVADACVDRYLTLDKKELKKRDAIVGDRRYMVTVDIKKPFNRPDLFANDLLMDLLRHFFTAHCRIASFGIVAAWPGADDQPIHLDHPPLFADQELCDQLPPYAITAVIPLVNMIPEMGPTAIWSGSHVGAGRLEKLNQLMENPNYDDAELPVARLGDVYLMDYRLIHGGKANDSNRVRPVLYLVYSCPWFRDGFNFGAQPALQIGKKQLKKIPAEHRGLFRG